MMNQPNPQDLAEEFGDGYSNEFQRAHAWSAMTTPRPHAFPKAEHLAAEGKFVLVSEHTVYCRITDGILGGASHIEAVADTRAEIEAILAAKLGDEYDETSYTILPRLKVAQAPVIDQTDDIPF